MSVRTPLLWLASGFLFGFSFISPYLFWCFIPAFVLLLYAIKHEVSYIRTFLFGCVVGAIQYAGSFLWVWTTYPINWIPEGNTIMQFTVIGFYWVLTSLVMGLAFGLFAVVLKRVTMWKFDVLYIVPTLWLFSELLKSLLFSLYTLGDGGFISFGFSFGYIGYLVADYGAWLSFASVAGVYGLSFVCALLGVIAYLFFVHHAYTKWYVCVVMFFFFVSPFLVDAVLRHPYEKTQEPVYVVETYFDKKFFTADNAEVIKQERIQEAVEAALQQQAKTIILPEDTHVGSSFENTDAFFDWVIQMSGREDVVIVDNNGAKDARGIDVLRTYIYDTKTRSVYFADKKYLVPQGEFMSVLHKNILSLFVTDEQLNSILAFTRLRAGVMRTSQALPHDLPGILFCFETAVPFAVKEELARHEAPFIAHSISHGWFTEPDSLENQLNQMLKVHAVWNKIPIVSAGTMVESHLYLPNGDVEKGEVVKEGEYWAVKKFSL